MKEWICREISMTTKNVENGILMRETELIRCKDCKFYARNYKKLFHRGSDCLKGNIGTIVPDRDFCSRAEKYGEEE